MGHDEGMRLVSDYLIMKAVEFDKLPVKFRKKYPDTNDLLDAGYWVQDKYDGCMGIAVMRYDGGSQMLSRTGEDYTLSCGHILEELREAADDQTGSWDDFIVIGEVWLPIAQAKFPAISGMFRRQKGSALKFIANDLLPPEFNTDRPYRLRFADLCELLPVLEDANVFVTVANTLHAYPANVERYAARKQAEGGYDGAIMRNPDAGYTVGTVKNGEIVKIKPRPSLDLRVKRVAVFLRDTKLGGSITVDLGNDLECDVGTGLTQAMLKEFQTELQDGRWINKIAEVEFLGFTEDGKLREPAFKGLRIDKLVADR